MAEFYISFGVNRLRSQYNWLHYSWVLWKILKNYLIDYMDIVIDYKDSKILSYIFFFAVINYLGLVINYKAEKFMSCFSFFILIDYILDVIDYIMGLN